MKSGFFSSMALIALLAACSGPIETRVHNAGSGVAPVGSYRVVQAPGDASDVQQMALAETIKALAAMGWTQSDKGQHLLSVAVAERPAQLGLAVKTGAEPQSLAVPKPVRLMQSCKDREYRVTVALVDGASGAMAYRGSAAEYHCREQLANVLPLMVDMAVQDMRNPGQQRALVRSGRE